MVNLNLKNSLYQFRSFIASVRSSVLVALVLFFASGFALGQTQAELELRLEREAKYEAWKVIRRYQQYHRLVAKDDSTKFSRLFSENATHVMDVPFYNHNNEKVDQSVSEYIGMYERFFIEAKNNRVEVRPLHMNVKKGNAGLVIEVYCEKKFFGKIDVQGSDVVYPEAQHLLLTLAVKNGDELMEHWNSGASVRDRFASPPSLELKIESVRWDSTLQETYFLTLIDNQETKLIFPCREQVMVIAESSNWRLVKSNTENWVVRDSTGSSIDGIMSANRYNQEVSRSDVLKLRKIPGSSAKPWSWQFGVGTVAMNNRTVEDALGNQASWGLQHSEGIRVALGYLLKPSHRRFIWDVNFGIGVFNTQFEYMAQQITFDEASVDPDGFQYIRETAASDWGESIGENAVFAELSTMGLWAVSGESRSKLWLGVQGGYSVGMWSKVLTNSEAQVFHQGYYPELYGITIDEAGIYDFGSHNGSGTGQHQWKGSGQINLSGLIGVQVHPAWMVVGKIGGVRATRRAGDDELRYMDGTNTLNAASQQLQSLSLNCMTFSLGLRKRITGQDKIELECIE